MTPARPQTAEVKQSETFSLAGTIANLGSDPWTGKASVRNQEGTWIQDLSITLTAPTAPDTLWIVVITANPESTAEWPIGIILCDIRLTYLTTVIISPTFNILVKPAQTLPETP